MNRSFRHASFALRRAFFRLSFAAIFAGAIFAQDGTPGANPPLQTGNLSALTKIEVFNDYQCGACVRFNAVLKKVEKAHRGKVLITFRNFPLSIPSHNNNYPAARAVEAAAGKESLPK
jgi:protein-disulfide isomerase